MADIKTSPPKPAPASAPSAETAPTRTTLLTRYKGRRPTAPSWFKTALAAPRVDGETLSDARRIVWRRWGEATPVSGRQGLIFVHGGVAHLGWWDFIAPFFAADWTPMALSLSGMGESDHGEEYSVSRYADEILAAGEAAGLFALDAPPIVVGHSFGGFATLATSIKHGRRLAGAVIADSPIRPTESSGPRAQPQRRGGRVYASRAEALSRFRLLPDQDCANHFLLDHIARTALAPAVGEDGASGVAWRHDPNLWLKMTFTPHPPAEMAPKAACPLAFMRGARSRLVTDEVWRFMASLQPGAPQIDVPEADHHLMLDQPLGFVAGLRGLLSAWPPAASA